VSKIQVEERDDGSRLFHLRNDVKLLVTYATESKLRVQMWTDDAIAAIDEGNVYLSSFRQKYVDGDRKNDIRGAAAILFGGPDEVEGRDADAQAERDKRKRLRSELLSDFAEIATAIAQPTATGQSLHAIMGTSAAKKNGVTERLVRYGRKGAEFFHTPDRKPYAAVKVGDHTEHYEIKKKGGGDFGFWLEQEYWTRETERLQSQQGSNPVVKPVPGDEPLPDVVRDRDLTDALRTLRGLARFKGKTHEVYRRVAGHGGKVYIDLCNEDWRVVEVDSERYRVIEGHEAPVRFARTPGMLALPEPVKGGSLAPLRDLLHLGDGDAGERNWRLIVTWLVQALSPYGSYSILSLFGNQGSGKSNTQAVLRTLVDPSGTPLRGKPREERDLFIAASNAWAISLDNMSKVPEWLSNALCVICTHGSYGLRANYEDDEEVLFKARRPILINGIGDILTYPDLLDRAAIVRLPAFNDEGEDAAEERKPDDEVIAAGEEIAPGVLGALLDCLSYYLANQAEIANPRTRMVTYAKIGVAMERYLEWGEDAFMRAYKESRGEATAQVLDAHPISPIVIDFLEDYPEDDPWESTPRELLDALNRAADESVRRSDGWPSSANQLGSQLNALATNLRAAGVVFERYYQHASQTMYRLFRK
jgi:hypothetical protein